jgi:hypothetical protein
VSDKVAAVEFPPYGKDVRAESSDDQPSLGVELGLWFFSTVILGVVPFAAAAIAYRAFYDQDGHHHWPSMSQILGHGEILLVILTVTGATIGELLFYPSDLGRGMKGLGAGISALIALGAFAVFSVASYASLVGEQSLPFAPDRHFIAVFSITLLTCVVLVHILSMLSRHSTPER